MSTAGSAPSANRIHALSRDRPNARRRQRRAPRRSSYMPGLSGESDLSVNLLRSSERSARDAGEDGDRTYLPGDLQPRPRPITLERRRAPLRGEDYVRWTRRVQPQVGDVVFSYETRASARPHASRLGCGGCLGRRMGLLRARKGEVDERFLLYAYLGPQFQETLRSRTIHGSTAPICIPLNDMPGFPFAIPDDLWRTTHHRPHPRHAGTTESS